MCLRFTCLIRTRLYENTRKGERTCFLLVQRGGHYEAGWGQFPLMAFRLWWKIHWQRKPREQEHEAICTRGWSVLIGVLRESHESHLRAGRGGRGSEPTRAPLLLLQSDWPPLPFVSLSQILSKAAWGPVSGVAYSLGRGQGVVKSSSTTHVLQEIFSSILLQLPY